MGFFSAPDSSFLGNDLTRGKSVAEPWDCPQPDTAWRDVLILCRARDRKRNRAWTSSCCQTKYFGEKKATEAR